MTFYLDFLDLLLPKLTTPPRLLISAINSSRGIAARSVDVTFADLALGALASTPNEAANGYCGDNGTAEPLTNASHSSNAAYSSVREYGDRPGSNPRSPRKLKTVSVFCLGEIRFLLTCCLLRRTSLLSSGSVGIDLPSSKGLVPCAEFTFLQKAC